MDLATAFAEINWLSVIVATLAAFGLGSLWYSPVLVGKAWQTEVKLSDEDIKDANMPMIFGGAFFLNFIAAIVLDMFLGKEATLTFGFIAGLLVALAWISTALGINYLFTRKSFKLFLIDAGYFLIYYAIMGTILGAWK